MAKSSEDLFLEAMFLKTVSQKKIQIELETRGQSSNSTWQNYRETHITASIFHTVCHLKPETLLKFSSQILNKKIVKTNAMIHGIIHEKVAIKNILRLMSWM